MIFRLLNSTALGLSFILLTGCAGGNNHATAPDTRDIPGLALLNRGVNLSHWLTHTSIGNRENFITGADLSLVRNAGFQHVRLPFKPELLLDEENPDILNQAELAYLDKVISLILGEGLGLIIDPHPAPPFKKRLDEDPLFRDIYVHFWEKLANHLSRYPAETVFLEVLNEPHFQRSGEWEEFQKDLLRAMRRGAPLHTLIATGYHWSTARDLVELEPGDDPNVIYNFHFYHPPIFTHQGATWGRPLWKYQKNIPYPSSPKKVEEIIPGIADYGARSLAKNYGRERWDREKLDSLLQPAVRWAKKNRVRLICGEFGVYLPAAPPADRRIWIKDLRELLEKYGISWTVWDYAGGFDITIPGGKKRRIDPAMLVPLGLEDNTASTAIRPE